ncbi:hypothetical protein TNCV_2067661 [Trichonephila clavipes]|uniref:Uncharacterized protein n=1 Tax=Trichonephila clavipes TaxID=2585209 RepID=A0A8X6W328_TRICX|nr:hypothetical protein TNCV_2067661 [Trichonephila clavipes]
MNVLNVMSEWDYTNERVLFWMEILNGYVRPLPRRIFMAALSHDSLNNEAFKAFVKIRCPAVASTRKRSAIESSFTGDPGREKEPHPSRCSRGAIDPPQKQLSRQIQMTQ